MCCFRKVEDLQFAIEEMSIEKGDTEASTVTFFHILTVVQFFDANGYKLSIMNASHCECSS